MMTPGTPGPPEPALAELRLCTRHVPGYGRCGLPEPDHQPNRLNHSYEHKASASVTEPESAAPWSAVRPRWSPRRWLVTLAVAAALAGAVIVFSSAPWWTALILGVCLPAAVYGNDAQRNMEWFGYHRCPTCNGSGKVRDA